jgi:hypothetical protein
MHTELYRHTELIIPEGSDDFLLIFKLYEFRMNLYIVKLKSPSLALLQT